MATPQAHGVITILILIVFRLFSKITVFEYSSALIWGMGIDIDHFFVKSWDYWKNVFRRVCNGEPENDSRHPASWLHLWPGMILVLFYSWLSTRWQTSFRFYLPFVFWFVHVGFDFLQKSEHPYPWYPLSKRFWEPRWGYPNKSPHEIKVCCALLIVLGFLLFSLWNF